MSRFCRVFACAAVAMLVLGSCSGEMKTPDEKRLLKDLLRNYSAVVRPAVNQEDVITVTCDAALQTITHFNQKDQYIITNTWFRFNWEDYHFRWDPDDYGGATDLVVPVDTVWRPDITLRYNLNRRNKGFANNNVILTNTGVVYWNTPANFKSPCKIDPTYFPFDEQRCLLEFTALSYSDDRVHLAVSYSSGDLSNYRDNGIWELLGVRQEVSLAHHHCFLCQRPFTTFALTIVLKRRPLFYLSNLLVPCATLTVITGICFLLAADSGEKISLVVTNLLSLIVLLLQLSDFVPATSEGIPLMVQYFAAIIAIVSISVVMTVFVLRVHHRPGLDIAPVPAWLWRLVLTYLARVLLVRVPAFRLSRPDISRDSHLSEEPSVSRQPDDGGQPCPDDSAMDTTLLSISDHVRCIGSRCRHQDCVRQRVSEWKHVAKVFDRALFVIFLISTVVFTLAIFCQPVPMTSQEEVEWMRSRVYINTPLNESSSS